MRKALIGLIMAATAMTPVAAQAQESRTNDTDRQEHYLRLEQRNQQRHEQRQQRQEARQQTQQVQQTQQAQPEQQAARVVQRRRVERRGGDGQRVERRGDGQRFERRSGEFQRVEQQSGGQTSQAWQGDPDDPNRQRYERLERRNQWRYGTPEQRETIRQQQGTEGRDWRRGDRNGRDWRRGDRDWRRDWNRTSWRNDRRYDWQNWRYRNRSLFRLSPYYSPYRNYGYSRFSIGFFMEPLFYSQRYWLNDPYQYRLPYAPPGTQWIRYYNDVLLVDTWTGEVVDVIYNFFW